MLVLERNREQVLSETPLAHLFLSLRHLCCRNRSMTPFLCFVEQMFCCQLEELIRWLYNVADVTGSWVPPSPDAESVLASLHRYLVGCHPCSASLPLSCAAGSKQWEARHHWNGPGGTGFAKPNLGAPGTCSEETAPWATCHRCVSFKNPSKQGCSSPCLARSSGRMWPTTGA